VKGLYDVAAPAKLNLFLHVTGRRPDGMHLLQSVFMLVDWCDTLQFEWRPAGLSREDLGAPLPADDLCLRAARALQQASGCTQGAHIAIDKRLPSQAGLGGGSSDAATCLLALNRLWGLGLRLPALEAIGLTLGADVPFFLRGRNAWVEGIGEQITPLDLPRARFLVVKPPQGLETGRMFTDPGLNRSTKPAILSGFAAVHSDTPSKPENDASMCERVYGFGHNDLQPVAQRLCPGISEALAWLSAQGLRGRMTGSGSAVFARLAPGVQPGPPPTGWHHGWVMKTCGNLEVHPLVGWAASDSHR